LFENIVFLNKEIFEACMAISFDCRASRPILYGLPGSLLLFSSR
jgi:hypothetical protein